MATIILSTSVQQSTFTKMTERNIAAEVLDGLREAREHRAGKRTLRTVRGEPRPVQPARVCRNSTTSIKQLLSLGED